MKKFWIGRIVKGIIFFSLAIIVFGFVVMNLWNWLMPSLFAGIHTIDFVHAIGLIVLCKILFGFGRGGFGHHGGPPWKRGGMYWKQKWEDKLSHMSPEERERFKSALKNRCRTWGFNPEEKFNPAAPPPPAGDAKM